MKKIKNEKRAKSIQPFLFILGILFVGFVIFQSVYATNLQEKLGNYEKNMDSAENMRDSLVIIADEYLGAISILRQLDREVNFKYENGSITEEEANMTIHSNFIYVRTLFSFIFGNVLVWDPNHDGAFEAISSGQPNNKFYNATKKGAYVVKPDFEWIFSENVITAYWFPRFYNEIALIDPKFENWENINITAGFQYEHFGNLFTDEWVTWAVKIDQMDYSLNWFYWEVDFEIFDDYVESTIVNYILSTQIQLKNIQNAALLNTIGVLLTGFIIDFGDKKGWRILYLIIALSTLILNGLFLYLGAVNVSILNF